MDDHDRPLAPRGEEALARLRRYVADNGLRPALVLCSSARRAEMTCRGILPALPAGATVEPQPLPEGYRLREYAGAADDQTAFQLIEDAFNEWPDRDPATIDDWAANTVRRPGFEPWQIRFVEDLDGTAVGVCFTILAGATGYVDQIAVRRDQRGLGLARALLADAFERARGHGATVSELSTDSRTGALGLYEHVGMTVTQTWRHWMTDL